MMELIYLKSALKCYSFTVTSIKIPFFRVSVTIEPGRSLLQFVTTNCLIFNSNSTGFAFQESFFMNYNKKAKL